MKNKITSIFALLGIMTASGSFAQDFTNGLSIKISAGYSIFTPGSDRQVISPAELYNPQGGLVQVNSAGQNGEGFHFGLGAQKDFGEILIATLDISYTSQNKLTNNSYFDVSPLQSKSNGMATGSMFTATPGVSFKVFHKANYYIYTHLGLILAFNEKYHSINTDTYPNFSPYQATYDDEYHYGVNPGLQGGLGVQFHLSGKISGFAELENNFLNLSAKTLQGTIYNTATPNGTPALIDTHLYKFSHSSSGTTSSNTTNNYTTGVFIPSIQHFNSSVLTLGIACAIR
jgi:hypothetical protein